MKQMISHLLGVATGFLNGKFEIKDIEFIYLLFDPTVIEIKDEKAKTQIYEIYKNTCDECNATDFKALFEVIIDYLQTERNVGQDKNKTEIVNNFSFKLIKNNVEIKKINHLVPIL